MLNPFFQLYISNDYLVFNYIPAVFQKIASVVSAGQLCHDQNVLDQA